MNLIEAEKLAKDQIGKHLSGWSFRWLKKVKRPRTAGSCDYRNKQIELAPVFVELNAEARVLNTILHEIAHAILPPTCGHNRIWQSKAREIGCDGKRRFKSCSICRVAYEGFGNNAEPINSGRCCDACNEKVIAARIKSLTK